MASSGGIGGSSPSHWHLFGDEGHSVKWHSCRTCDLVLSYRPEAILLPVDTFQEAEMATGDADALGPLEFTSYDVTDLASLAPYFLPSGHTMAAMSIAAPLVILAWNTRFRWPTLVLAAIYVVAVGATRVYLGAHFPSDVLAGWCLTVLWVSAVVMVVRYLARISSKIKTE